MNHLPFTLLAYFLNSISVLIDKLLLTKSVKNPLIYIFYISIFSLVGLLLLPWTHIPDIKVFSLASISTILWTTGAYCMFHALQKGLASRVIPVIGTLIPLILTVNAILTGSISYNEVWAVGFLVLGLIFLTLWDWKGDLSVSEIIFELLSAFLFATSYIILHEAYKLDDFLTVFVYSRMILIPVGIFLVLLPFSRKIVLAKDSSTFKFMSLTGLLFLIGQFCGGTAELLLTYSISLANPALVNSLQGTQYVFLFVFSLILSRKFPQIFAEKLSVLKIITKIFGILLLAFGLYLLAYSHPSVKMKVGVTFSPRYVQGFNLSPEEVFYQMMTDLNVRNIRLPVYWDEVEHEMGVYDFSKVDYYLDQAQRYDIKVILSLGYKQPRWPECFAPEWVNSLSKNEFDQRILSLVKNEVEHFRKYDAVVSWQVENEPFIPFEFGVCNPHYGENFDLVKNEIDLVKSLDSRPILITDSGELSNWKTALKLSDEFGISLYRVVWNPMIVPGLVEYPFPPFYYQGKDKITKALTSTSHKNSIISELQAEAWGTEGRALSQIPSSEVIKLFPAEKIGHNYLYAKETGFETSYFWGVEWWYYMQSQGYGEYVEEAKKIFRDP